MKPVLTEADYKRAALALKCPVAAVKAVCAVEAPKGGFQTDGQPRILFERHHFSKRTGGRFDAKYPGISNRTAGGYGLESAQHGRLGQAAALDRDAALSSTSWGKFQIMGFNFEAAGFPSLQSFINAMYHSEGAQLDAFVSFVKRDRGGKVWAALLHGVSTGDWKPFASLYNGPAFAINRYDTKLAAAFTLFNKAAA